MRRQHLRPTNDFTVTSLAWQREIEANRQRAGFDPVPDEVLVRRFWQFLRFIQRHGLTTCTIAVTAGEISDGITLRNSDLTDKGFYFIQRFHSRWLNRSSKDGGEPKEDAFLAKWYGQFLRDHEVA